MLSENIRTLRKAKGLSQEELAVKLNVVRQTVSKWEKGLSVPDADCLIALAEELETPVSDLLGESATTAAPEADAVKAIAQKLEVINAQLARRADARRKTARGIWIALAAVVAAIALLLLALHSPYLGWDYADPEKAVLGVAMHAFEWGFVRLAPFALAAAIAGIVCTRKKRG